MKVAFISPSFYPATYYGGPIFASYNFTKALACLRIELDVLTTNANGKERLKTTIGNFINDSDNLKIKYYKSLDSRGTSLGLLANLKRDLVPADIIYIVSVFSPPTPLALYLSKKLNKPLIICPNGELGSWCLNQGSRFKKLWLRLFVTPFSEKIFWHVTSDDEEKMVKAVYSQAKTFILPNGVDLAEFETLPLEKYKSFFNKYTGYDCSQKKIIVSMGRLHKIKGFDILISAFAELQKLVPNLFRELVLLIAGEDFGEKMNIEQLIGEKNLKGKVFLVGKLDGKEKLEFLHNADVFALASHHENFGMVYAEALASGTPIVASLHTPWNNVEKHNCGKWIDNTSEAVAKAIIEILNSDYLKMGENGKNFVGENYGWEKIAGKFINTLNKILNEK